MIGNKIFGFLRFLSKLLIDFVAFFTAFFLALIFRQQIPSLFVLPVTQPFPPVSSFVFVLWWVPFIFFAILLYFRLYSVRLPFWEEVKLLTKSVFVFMFFLLFAFTLKKGTFEISRLFVLLFGLFLILLLPLFRYFGKRFLTRVGIWKESVLIIGAGQAGKLTARGLYEEPHLGYDLVAFLDDDISKIGSVLEIASKKIKVYGPISKARKFIKLLDIRTVFICIPSLSEEDLASLVNEIYRYAENVIVVPQIEGVSLYDSEMHYLFLERVFFLKLNNNLHSLSNRFFKRLFDLSLALLISPIVFPLMGLVALLVKMTSKGPVFFVQRRMGIHHRPFWLIKFRTMYLNGDEILKEYLEKHGEARKEWVAYKKLKGFDPRITPIGRFLRKTSLDEIPQIINILLGNMSLVGPRPYSYHEKRDMFGIEEKILMTKPGITGLWQVSGRKDLVFSKRVDLDAWYVDNWSLWLDVMILFKTILLVLKREGAY